MLWGISGRDCYITRKGLSLLTISWNLKDREHFVELSSWIHAAAAAATPSCSRFALSLSFCFVCLFGFFFFFNIFWKSSLLEYVLLWKFPNYCVWCLIIEETLKNLCSSRYEHQFLDGFCFAEFVDLNDLLTVFVAL